MAGRDFWHHLCKCMAQIGFTSSQADPDVWSGEVYYEYVLLYVDNVLVILEQAESVLSVAE